MDLLILVKQIKGTCPIYHTGDLIVIREGHILDTTRSSQICMHSLASLMPYYVALSRGLSPQSLGLSQGESVKAHVQCLDPCDVTGGGRVLLEISATNNKSLK